MRACQELGCHEWILTRGRHFCLLLNFNFFVNFDFFLDLIFFVNFEYVVVAVAVLKWRDTNLKIF